jgi:hypothetical protein
MMFCLRGSIKYMFWSGTSKYGLAMAQQKNSIIPYSRTEASYTASPLHVCLFQGVYGWC